MTVNRQLLMQATQRAAILTNEKFRENAVLAENVLKLIAANAEQEEAVEEIEVNYNGDAIDVGFTSATFWMC